MRAGKDVAGVGGRSPCVRPCLELASVAELSKTPSGPLPVLALTGC